jgi:molybdenum cofactor cytidylyltransferase
MNARSSSDPSGREQRTGALRVAGGRTRIAGILLAAGLARRMGRQKLLLDVRGKSVVRWSAERLATHVHDLIVVTGHDGDAVRAALHGVVAGGSGPPVRFAANPRPAEGQGTSIACGAVELGDDVGAVFVALGDQPDVPAAVFSALLAALRPGVSIVAPVYRGTQGTPVLFGADVFPELRVLRGDTGARPVVMARPERVHREMFDLAMPDDVDTPEDYARLV